MALNVNGAGFGRTGTRSLKTALEGLGFGRCYHMEEVLKNPNWASVFFSFTYWLCNGRLILAQVRGISRIIKFVDEN